ncbi:restriction endonuclease [Pseudoalteromonas xiamenensis]
MDTNKPSLFVWRDWLDQSYIDRTHWENNLTCIYCSNKLGWSRELIIPENQDFSIDTDAYSEAKCQKCGWVKRKWKSWHTQLPSVNSGRWVTHRGLRHFEISDPRLAIEEIATHLKRRYSDIHSITPRQFEMLVASIFKSLGWEVRLTKETRDGGVDIYLLQKSNNEQAIVECKRYKNKVSIGVVDRLLGVQLSKGIKKAYLVTSSEFTQPALDRATSPHISKSGFEVDLCDAEYIARALNVFNEDLPPLFLEKNYK